MSVVPSAPETATKRSAAFAGRGRKLMNALATSLSDTAGAPAATVTGNF